MRLLSCYIENFGNISRRDYDFADGLTAYCEQNGYGKTTLASFLKVMFYGMKSTRASDKEVGERERYYPFDGGKFGGNVTFEINGTVYKIERFFGKKSATEDEIKLYRDGTLQSVSDDFEAGKEFFGMDEQSFLRTVFVNSDDTEIAATGDISRMLNEFVDDADFEGAMAALEKLRKEYKATRGNNDKISRQKNLIADLKNNIENKQKISDGLKEKYVRLNALKDEVEVLREKQNSVLEINVERQKWETYDNYRKDADEAHRRFASVRAKYPSGLPDADEAQALLNCAGGISLAKERLAAIRMTEEKEARLDELKSRFKNGFPTDEALSSVNALTEKRIRLDTEIEGMSARLNGEAQRAQAAAFPDKSEIEKYGEKLTALRELKENKDKPVQPKSHKKLLLIPAILSLVLIGAGVGLWFVKTLIGIILLAVGAGTAIVTAFLYFKSQLNIVKAAADTSLSEKISDLENEIRGFLSRFGYFTLSGVEVDFNNLLRDVESYEKTVSAREENIRVLNAKAEERDAVNSRIKEFLSGYGFTGENEQADLAELNWLIAEYAVLNDEKENSAARIASCNAEIKKHTDRAIDVLSKYDIIPDGNLIAQANEISADRKEYLRLIDSFKELDRRALNYRAENNLTNRPIKSEEDGADVKELLDKKIDELTRLDRDIDEDESVTEKLNELIEELASAEAELKELQKQLDVIKKTAALLATAEENLKDRYVRPIKDSFLKYSQMLERALGEKVTMDKQFKVYFERSGENRSDAHLSAGQKSLCTLCLRLALIDNMYKDDRPFIIMDDPFVHLDAEHMQRAKSLLADLAGERQVIYFCCHSSRKI